MDVNLASQAHHTPQVGLPHSDPVTIEIKLNINPTNARLFAINEINLILKIKLHIDASPINPKIPRAIKDEGTCTYIILTDWPCTKSGGEINNAYIIPTDKITIIKIVRFNKNLLFNERILNEKKFLII